MVFQVSEGLLPAVNFQLFQCLSVLTIVLYLGRAIYRYSFSSIADIPAPSFVASVSIWWQAWHAIKGDTHTYLVDLHRTKGTFVRVSHKEVAVCHPDAIPALLMKPLPKVGCTSVCMCMQSEKLTVVHRRRGIESSPSQTKAIKIKCQKLILHVTFTCKRT